MQLRDYQQKSVDKLYEYISNNEGKNPCLQLPTGGGKSHVVAKICMDSVINWPETRVLMLSHVKEILEQNSEKLRQHWRNAPLGIFSASVGRKELGEPITFAGIQSVRNRANELGHIDLVIIDECHLVSHKEEGSYRNLINELKQINGNLIVIGLTATPYRLGHGLITEGGALFDDIIEPITVKELIDQGYLATLRSKSTAHKLDVEKVKKRGGEYIESALQAAVNTLEDNEKVIEEVIKRAEDRKAWLFFCTGVDHATEIKELLINRGIKAEVITGKTPKKEREKILDRYKRGEIQALANANVLTTGFDYPNIDLIALIRPTMSPALYVQMVGRGLRLKDHTDHCLVLDFAGNITRHGPITNIREPEKTKGRGEGKAPTKDCPDCDEIVHLSCMKCPSCGFEFEKNEKEYSIDNTACIMGETNTKIMEVTSWKWLTHTSRTSGKEMIKCIYYGQLSDRPITEYIPVTHDGAAGRKAINTVKFIASRSGSGNIMAASDLIGLVEIMNNSPRPPSHVEYTQEGKFFNIVGRLWSEEKEENVA